MPDVDIPAATRTIRPDKVVPFATGLKEGWIAHDSFNAREELHRAGFVVMTVTAGLTANSRRRTSIDVVCRDEKIAGLAWHTLVQLLGLAAARRRLDIPPLTGWKAQAETHVRYDHATKRFVKLTVPDGVWDEYGPDGLVRSWLLEYSHGEFERRRLREKVRRYGPNPQLWVTPSTAHAAVIDALLQDMFPTVPRRVLVVDWTGGEHVG